MTDQNDQIIFKCVSDVIEYFRKVGVYVGSRKGENKRTDEQREYFNLRQYLPTLAINELLQYPLFMRKSESPDFLFENEITWGVEITQATNPHYQKQLTEMEEGNFECILQGDGWVGNGPEREAYSEILRAIEAKIKKIEKYQDASRHDLLIYVDIEPFFYNSDKAIDMLRPQVKQLSSHCEKVGKISIIAHNYIYYDIVGDAIRMKQYDYATC